MENSFILLAIFTALGCGVFIQSLLLRRAISQVIQTFCRYNALGVTNAKEVEEMGLTPPRMIQRLIRLRDYKPYAIQLLQQAGIIRVTEDGRAHMTEEKLSENMRCKAVWQPNLGNNG